MCHATAETWLRVAVACSVQQQSISDLTCTVTPVAEPHMFQLGKLHVMGSNPALAFVLLFSAALTSCCDGGKVLVYPVDGSHWLNMKILVEALHSRGHQVTVLRSSTSWYVSEISPHYTSITITQEQSQNIESQDFMTSFLKRSIEIRRNKGSPKAFLDFYRNLFDMIAENQEAVAKLVISILENKTLGTDIWLMRIDFTFEFPRPTMPNVVYIGGFQGKPSKPLPPDLEEFVQSSGEHGVVVMTLGTLLSDLGPEISEAIASAFASLPQKVIWRHIGERPTTLGNNTMLVEWLPQNDILGHPKTKVFVTHGGTNGIYEAIYHGVPVLGIPLIFDQYDNMVRLKARGVAEIVEVTTLDVESLTNALKNILSPEKPYKENMHKLSQLHLDKPIKPLDSAVFWMEFVMRHKGAAHLRTEIRDQRFWNRDFSPHPLATTPMMNTRRTRDQRQRLQSPYVSPQTNDEHQEGGEEKLTESGWSSLAAWSPLHPGEVTAGAGRSRGLSRWSPGHSTFLW
ncbi:hypothetical protein INR49_031704 [Caranx melampygus]|nr:hypothetical protein INR49_031704 [Caranx melampygus]